MIRAGMGVVAFFFFRGNGALKLPWRQTCREMSFISRELSGLLSITLLLEQNCPELHTVREKTLHITW